MQRDGACSETECERPACCRGLCNPHYRRLRKGQEVSGEIAPRRQRPFTEKQCFGCGETKPLSAYHKNRNRFDGLQQRCKQCSTAYAVAHRRGPHGDRRRRMDREAGKRLRGEVQAAYGGRCACCGESEPAFLAVDHVNGDGAKERRDLKVGTGRKFYGYLKRSGFPRGRYRLLCHNCNMGIALLSSCPHQEVGRVEANC